MPPPAIVAEELSKRLGKVLALDRISFSVEPGTLLGVLGQNGAGKSTLMQVLAGQVPPTRGRALVLGTDIAGRPRKLRRRVGLLQQQPQFQADLSLLEHLRLFADAHGLPHRKSRLVFDELCHALHLLPDLAQPAATWPSGTRKRAGLLFALLPRPEVLLLDEPTAGTDLYDQLLFWDLFQDLSARGTTVCVTTHRPEEAEYCHQVAVLAGGRLVEMGSPFQLKMRHGGGLAPGLPSLLEVFAGITRRP